MMSQKLTRAVGLLSACLTAVEQCLRGTKNEATVRNAIKPKKRDLQIILEEGMLNEVAPPSKAMRKRGGQIVQVAAALPAVKREIQVVLEYLSDAIDYSRHPRETKLEQSLEVAASLLKQLIEEITAGEPKAERIEAVRVRTQRPFGQGYKGGAPPLRRTERGVATNGSRRSHIETYSFVAACY